MYAILAKLQKDEHEKACYFFTPRERKYKNGSRPNRAVKENQEGQGYWKATGRDEEIKDPKTKEVVALKKTLVYYHGKPRKDVKTDWIMQEYTMPSRTEQSGNAEMAIKAEPSERAAASDMRLDDWVLCKIYLNSKGTKKRKKEEKESNNDARKEPRIDEDASYERSDVDEEINKLLEDGEEECIIEGQAVVPNPVITPPTPATASNNHGHLLMQHSGPLRHTQQNAGSLAMQATGSLTNQLQPMQAAGPASYAVQQMQVVGPRPLRAIAPPDFGTPSAQLGGPSKLGYLPHNRVKYCKSSPLQTGGMPYSGLEHIQPGDLTYDFEAMLMMSPDATTNTRIKVEDFTDLSAPHHNHFGGFVNGMPHAENNYFQSQASFYEPQLTPFSDALASYQYEYNISAEKSFAMQTTFDEGIEATAYEAQCIRPRRFHSSYMLLGDDFDCKPSSSNG
ncbi:hypothetical protein ACLOJK_024910 [Asimina triloba]